jgi:putative membrane protein
MSPPSTAEPGVLRAGFNPLIRPYLVLYVAMILLATIVFIPLIIPWLLGVGQWWARHYFDLLECELGPTNLRFRKGIIFQVEKTVPLENIQDVTFIEGPLLRRFHLSILKFETAGQSHGQANAMSLVGIIDAADYRTQILARREALKRELGRGVSAPDTAGGDAALAELVAIRTRLDEVAALLRDKAR